MDEPEVRQKALQWLNEHYRDFAFTIPLMIFHGQGMSLTEYIKRNVPNPAQIPRYDSLVIEPDLAGLMNLTDLLSVWIIGECGYGKLTYGKLTQGTSYSDIARAYDGYLFYTERPTGPAQANIDKGNDMFQGVNRVGRPVRKRIRRYVLDTHDNFRVD